MATVSLPFAHAAQASLRGVRERAEQLQGELVINLGRQGGSQVTMRLPLPIVETVTSEPSMS